MDIHQLFGNDPMSSLEPLRGLHSSPGTAAMDPLGLNLGAGGTSAVKDYPSYGFTSGVQSAMGSPIRQFGLNYVARQTPSHTPGGPGVDHGALGVGNSPEALSGLGLLRGTAASVARAARRGSASGVGQPLVLDDPMGEAGTGTVAGALDGLGPGVLPPTSSAGLDDLGLGGVGVGDGLGFGFGLPSPDLDGIDPSITAALTGYAVHPQALEGITSVCEDILARVRTLRDAARNGATVPAVLLAPVLDMHAKLSEMLGRDPPAQLQLPSPGVPNPPVTTTLHGAGGWQDSRGTETRKRTRAQQAAADRAARQTGAPSSSAAASLSSTAAGATSVPPSGSSLPASAPVPVYTAEQFADLTAGSQGLTGLPLLSGTNVGVPVLSLPLAFPLPLNVPAAPAQGAQAGPRPTTSKSSEGKVKAARVEASGAGSSAAAVDISADEGSSTHGVPPVSASVTAYYESLQDSAGITSSRASSLTMQQLLDEGLLQAGPRLLHLHHKGKSFTADVLPNGSLVDSETAVAYATPSSWTLACKRSVDPAATADNGWKTAKLSDGRSLRQLWDVHLAAKQAASSAPVEPTVASPSTRNRTRGASSSSSSSSAGVGARRATAAESPPKARRVEQDGGGASFSSGQGTDHTDVAATADTSFVRPAAAPGTEVAGRTGKGADDDDASRSAGPRPQSLSVATASSAASAAAPGTGKAPGAAPSSETSTPSAASASSASAALGAILSSSSAGAPVVVNSAGAGAGSVAGAGAGAQPAGVALVDKHRRCRHLGCGEILSISNYTHEFKDGLLVHQACFTTYGPAACDICKHMEGRLVKKAAAVAAGGADIEGPELGEAGASSKKRARRSSAGLALRHGLGADSWGGASSTDGEGPADTAMAGAAGSAGEGVTTAPLAPGTRKCKHVMCNSVLALNNNSHERLDTYKAHLECYQVHRPDTGTNLAGACEQCRRMAQRKAEEAAQQARRGTIATPIEPKKASKQTPASSGSAGAIGAAGHLSSTKPLALHLTSTPKLDGPGMLWTTGAATPGALGLAPLYNVPGLGLGLPPVPVVGMGMGLGNGLAGLLGTAPLQTSGASVASLPLALPLPDLTGRALAPSAASILSTTGGGAGAGSSGAATADAAHDGCGSSASGGSSAGTGTASGSYAPSRTHSPAMSGGASDG